MQSYRRRTTSLEGVQDISVQIDGAISHWELTWVQPEVRLKAKVIPGGLVEGKKQILDIHI